MVDRRTETCRELYAASATRCTMIDVPALQVLSMTGEGDPATSSAFRNAAGSLVALAWGVRGVRRAQDPDRVFKVMPLEVVWSLPDELIFAEDPGIRSRLRWTVQTVLPDDVDLALVEYARAVTAKKKPELRAIDQVALREATGGLAAQILHRGPNKNQPATLDRLHCCIREHGERPALGHREIYLNDPRRTAPEKLRTILRVSVVDR